MRVVTDGDDGLRNFVQRSSPRPMESQLDWFHIGMRLQLLRKAVVMPVLTASLTLAGMLRNGGPAWTGILAQHAPIRSKVL
jgi:hypothetical protein